MEDVKAGKKSKCGLLEELKQAAHKNRKTKWSFSSSYEFYKPQIDWERFKRTHKDFNQGVYISCKVSENNMNSSIYNIDIK